MSLVGIPYYCTNLHTNVQLLRSKSPGSGLHRLEQDRLRQGMQAASQPEGGSDKGLRGKRDGVSHNVSEIHIKFIQAGQEELRQRTTV